MQFFKNKILKTFCLLLFLPIIISGCNKNSDNIQKITALPAHEAVDDFHSYREEDLINLGEINLRAGNFQKAIRILEKVTAYYPDNPIGQFYLGKAYYKNKRYEDSIGKFKYAFVLDKSYPEPLFYLGKAYEKTGKREKAIKALYKYLLIESNPYNQEKAREDLNYLSIPVVGKDVIGRIFVTDEIIREKKLAMNSKVCFRANVPEIFASIEVIGAPNNTNVEANWYYLASENKKMEVNSTKFTVNDSKSVLASLKKPSYDWPPGKYILEILVNKEKNASLNFYIF